MYIKHLLQRMEFTTILGKNDPEHEITTDIVRIWFIYMFFICFEVTKDTTPW